MVGPWRGAPYTFRACIVTFGKMWLRCDSCRRFAVLRVPRHLRDHDYRRVTFSCSRCGGVAACTVTEPTTEKGMEDYREDLVEAPRRHPSAEARLRLRSGRAFVPPKLRWKPTR